MRRIAMSAAAVIAATLVLAGCAAAEEPRGPQAPNGFTLSATLDDGSLLWNDLSDGSGLTDLILESPEGRYVHSCLGAAPTYCWDDARPSMMLVIAPADATEATLDWYGQTFTLTPGTPLTDESPAVFALVMPEYEANDQGWRLEVKNAAGEVVMTS